MLREMQIFGHLGQDPKETLFNDGKDMVTDISVAIDVGKEKPPVWVKCRFRGRVNSGGQGNRSIAERALEELRTGDSVTVSGKIDGYPDKNNEKASVLYLEAKDFNKHYKKPKEEGSSGRSTRNDEPDIPF